MQHIHSRTTSKGLTLIEILVAMVVGLLLLAGAVGMFISNQRVYREQQAMSRLQEDMRYTVDTLLYDIRMAGHVGCSDNPDMVRNGVGNSPLWAEISEDNLLEGMEGNGGTKQWEPGTDTTGVAAALANTDGIGVRFMQPVGADITADMATPSAVLAVTAVAGGDLDLLQESDALAVADCRGAEVFVASDDPSDGTIEHAAPENAAAAFSTLYRENAELFTFVSRRYLVQDDGGDTALFRYEHARDLDDSNSNSDTDEYIYHGQRLVDGVENMQLAYLANGTAFQAANQITDWGAITAVRLVLLFRTVDEDHHIPAHNTRYTLLGGSTSRGYQTPMAGDHRRRRVFSTTVQIRNRNT